MLVIGFVVVISHSDIPANMRAAEAAETVQQNSIDGYLKDSQTHPNQHPETSDFDREQFRTKICELFKRPQMRDHFEPPKWCLKKTPNNKRHFEIIIRVLTTRTIDLPPTANNTTQNISPVPEEIQVSPTDVVLTQSDNKGATKNRTRRWIVDEDSDEPRNPHLPSIKSYDDMFEWLNFFSPKEENQEVIHGPAIRLAAGKSAWITENKPIRKSHAFLEPEVPTLFENLDQKKDEKIEEVKKPKPTQQANLSSNDQYNNLLNQENKNPDCGGKTNYISTPRIMIYNYLFI
jgi:hypothetical protein